MLGSIGSRCRGTSLADNFAYSEIPTNLQRWTNIAMEHGPDGPLIVDFHGYDGYVSLSEGRLWLWNWELPNKNMFTSIGVVCWLATHIFVQGI
jgi:hypothetical protein